MVGKKISEDLKDEKGKPNEEGRLKATVVGELAYDDMMKRGREGKTGNISTGELNEAVMDVNSEVTNDKALEVKPEDLRAWGSAISQIDGPYPYADMISGVLNGVVWLMENDNRIKSKTKNSRKANEKAVKAAKKKYEEADKKYKEFKEKKNKTPKDKKNELYWKGQKAYWYKQMKELSEPHAINNVRH